MFSGVYWNQPVCLFVCPSPCVSVCVQNTDFCQSAGGGVKSHSVTLPNDEILDQSKFKAFADDKLKVIQMEKFVLNKTENIVGKE